MSPSFTVNNSPDGCSVNAIFFRCGIGRLAGFDTIKNLSDKVGIELRAPLKLSGNHPVALFSDHVCRVFSECSKYQMGDSVAALVVAGMKQDLTRRYWPHIQLISQSMNHIVHFFASKFCRANHSVVARSPQAEGPLQTGAISRTQILGCVNQVLKRVNLGSHIDRLYRSLCLPRSASNSAGLFYMGAL
jgi:hypothetical protein